MSIEIKNLTYVYMKKTSFEHTALKNISLTIEDGSFTAIAGHTGSGKSTLVQHLNGILQPTAGNVIVDGVDFSSKKKEDLKVRNRVGLVFQYPEHQLFEETVEKDIAFGPKNLGLSDEEIQQRVKEAMDFVQLDYEEFRKRSPFQLSGGQKRRVAIAGVLALKPRYLVLDEPTAGLDPKGRDDLLARIIKLHQKEKITIIFISHNMDDIARFADRIIVLNDGEIVIDDTPQKVFSFESEIKKAGLALPSMVMLLKRLREAGLDVKTSKFTINDGINEISKALKGRKRC